MSENSEKTEGVVRLMYQDEAGFGRISDPAACWCPKGIRPEVKVQRVREYVYTYGAVSPLDGRSFFLILPQCNTEMMNLYLLELSKYFPKDLILLAVDNAGWHCSNDLEVPGNIILFPLLPCTPELNPIEQIWKEIIANCRIRLKRLTTNRPQLNADH